jgi:Tfp pilus assembly protein PilX
MKRRGFVLVTALLVIVLVASLVAGVFFATMEESRIADTASSRELALVAAESAVAQTIETWNDRSAQPIGTTGAELSTFSDGDVTVTVAVTRLDSTLYSIVAEARSGAANASAKRRINAVVSVQNSIDHSILIDPIQERWWWELL